MARLVPWPEIGAELQQLMLDSTRAARAGNVAMFDAIDEETVDDRQARTLGSFYSALLSGVLTQSLMDPDSADDLVEVLRHVAASVADN